jgi:hypothetical protein
MPLSKHLKGVIRRGYLSELGRIPEIQADILLKKKLIYAAILLKHELVVGAADQKDIGHAFFHEQFKGSFPEIVSIHSVSKNNIFLKVMRELSVVINRYF